MYHLLKTGGEVCNKRRFSHTDRSKKKKKHGKSKALNKAVGIN